MANNLATLTHTTLASGPGLEGFRAALLPVSAFATNFSADAAVRGDKIKVPWVGSQDAAVTFSGTYTMQDADMEGRDITLDKHEFVSWSLTDKELSDNPQVNLERFARQKGFQLGKKVLQDILSLVTAASYGDTEGTDKLTTAAGSFDSDDVVDLSTYCDNKDFPEMDRSLILLPSYHAAIRKSMNDASIFGSDIVVRQGKVPSIDTFGAVYKSSLIPTNSENLVGMAIHANAILVAMRYLAPQAGIPYSTAEAITDAETGFTFGFREWGDPNTGAMKRVLECVYGRRTGNTSAIVRIESA